MSERLIAHIVNNEVVNVSVGETPVNLSGVEFLEVTEELPLGIGWHLYEGSWRSKSPYPSWVWDGYTWQPPIPMPEEGGPYEWVEENGQWASMDIDAE